MIVKVIVALTMLMTTNIADDLTGLRALTTWNVSQSSWPPSTPNQTCGIGDLKQYERTRLDHEVGSDIDGKRATHQIELLDGRVTDYLDRHHWERMKSGPGKGGIPNTNRCYQKQGVYVQVYQTTGRCTTNSPCTDFDGFAVIVYQPRTK